MEIRTDLALESAVLEGSHENLPKGVTPKYFSHKRA